VKEVSCRVFDHLLRELGAKGLPPDVLLQGTSYDIQKITDKHERVDWSTYVKIISNARSVWNEGEFVAMGATFRRTPVMRAFAVVARLLFGARDLYRWIATRGGVGNQMFTCIQPSYLETGGNRIRIEMVLDEGFEPCREMFLITRGSLASMPLILGLPAARVEMEEIERGARYDVVYPKGGGALRWVAKALAWPFTVQAAARELKEAHETLGARYRELDQARNVLALQAKQLTTANTISQLIRGDLDLDHTLRAVAGALIEVAGFASAHIKVVTERGGERIDSIASEGTPSGNPPMVVALEGRRGKIGELRVSVANSSDAERLRELLSVVLPTITLALEDAINYTEVLDYRQNLELKVEERTAELRLARDSLAETIDKMKEAQAARDRIFANINHEIRTPLSLVMLAVAQIKTRQWGRLDEKARAEVGSIETAGRRLLRLIDDLLLLAAGQERGVKLRPGRVDLGDALRLIVAAWAPAGERDRLTISYRGPQSCPAIVDENAIERIVTNLVSNAIKFTPDGGSIEVSLTDGPEQVTIAVRDTGIGIDDEFRARVFGRFEQGARPVRPGTHGSGIGLSLVKELAEAHHGTAKVESSRAGSIFSVVLPKSPPASAHSDGEDKPRERDHLLPSDFGLRQASDPSTVIEPRRRSRATILIAEDQPDLRAAIGEILHDDYKVVLAADGLSALRLAQTHLPDLLVSDINMPGMDGLELTRRFRELPGNRLAPVVLLTAYTGISDRLSGFEAGAIDYVVKPFEPDELRARIRSQLELRATALKLHQTEKLAALGTLSAGLAHELRNPANAMVNAIEPLVELLPCEVIAPDRPAGQLIEVMRTCADQVARLSRQLLGFKRSGELEKHEIAMSVLLSRALALVQPSLRNVTLREENHYQGEVWCSGSLLIQVLANLLENAAHAAGSGGWVRVVSRLDEGNLVIEVSDSGPGVPADLRERIFEPFFTTKPPGAGTGLGLTTAREIVARHHGVLEVREQDDSTVFHLAIPCARQSASLAAIPPREAVS
jgi:signal transduction histidine kinase